MKKIRVLIVEDSLVVRELLKHIISHDPRLEVAADVESAEEGLRILEHVSPDVISMDIRLPGIDGFEATRRVMQQRPTPVVVVSASTTTEDLNLSMNVLKAGALAVVEKPVGITHRNHKTMAELLCTQLAIMSQVKVIRQRTQRPFVAKPSHTQAPPCKAGPFRILGVTASTGGPKALVELFNGLGANFPLPILLVQHITDSFLKGFVAWLSGVIPFSTQIIRTGETPVPGTVYVAPPDRHLVLGNNHLRTDTANPVCAQRPSGTVLFQSMAQNLGNQALGVLLTGMGEDGAEGLLEIRQAGGYTIAEDASTAVVYGMPRVAVERGAACESIPLPAIAPRLLELVNKNNKAKYESPEKQI